MDHRIPRTGVAISIVAAAIAVITFIFLNLSFEGPNPLGFVTGEGYRLEAEFDDTEILPTKQPVLLRGLTVGKIKGVEFHKETSTATVEFSIDDEYAPLLEGTEVAVGERTLLGDPYLKVIPGSGPAELEPGSEVPGVDSVDFDEAFDFLDVEGRRHVRSLLDELDDATRSETGAEDLNATLGGLTRTVTELRALSEILRGQEAQLAGFVRDSATVLGELGRREAALRAIVASGRTTLEALAVNAQSLDEGLGELPGVLASAREVLAASRPLIAESAPLIAELRRAAPALSAVLADLPSVVADTVDIVGELSGIPTLREVLGVIKQVGPSVPGIEAAARNLVPLLRYTADRANGIAGFFANLRAAGQSHDSLSHWVRTAVVLDPNLGSDSPSTNCPQTLCFNAFPGPNDALDNEPFDGTYPRLRPFDPPPP